MRKIDASILAAKRDLEHWIDVLSPVRLSHSGAIDLSRLIGDEGINDVRLGFAVMQFTECCAELARLDNVRRRIYSNVSGRNSLWDDVHEISAWNKYLEEAGMNVEMWFDLLPQLTKYINETEYFGAQQNLKLLNVPDRAQKSFENLLDSLLESAQFLKDATMLFDDLRVLGDDRDYWGELVDFRRSLLFVDGANAEESSFGEELLQHYQQYLREEHIYSWLPNASSDENAAMQHLIDPIIETIQGRKEMVVNEVKEKYTDCDETVGAVEMIERLQEVLIHFGDYESMMEEILEGLNVDSELASGNPDSLLGGHGGVNVIPSQGRSGRDCEIVLALARGKGRSDYSFHSVLQELRVHLINYPDTEVAVLLTDRWAPDEFERHRQDIEAHMRQGTVFVPILVTGTALNVLAI